jgi:hypothetical protein
LVFEILDLCWFFCLIDVDPRGGASMRTRMKTLSNYTAFLALFALICVPIAVCQSGELLNAGMYSANVKAITCDGCGPLIKETMENTKKIDSVVVDRKASTVRFRVIKDKTVRMADLQSALKAAAAKMGMGADYTLSEVKVVK